MIGVSAEISSAPDRECLLYYKVDFSVIIGAWQIETGDLQSQRSLP